MAADAVLAEVGTPTMMSLATKRRSSKLGAGMPTLVRETKKAVRTMKRSPAKKTVKKTGVKKAVKKTGVKAVKKASPKRKSLKPRKKITKPKACKPLKLKSGKTVRRVRVAGKCVRRPRKLALSLGA